MVRFVPRAVMGAALVVSAAACAAGTATSGGSSTTGGADDGRYRVLVADAQIQPGVSERDGERVTNQLRGLINDMATHVSVDAEVLATAQRQYAVEQLDSISARQLAQQIGAQNMLWTEVSPGGSGVTGYAKFVDVSSGDVIRLEDVTAANGNELAQAIFAGIEGKIGGLRQAATCNEQLSSSQYEQALATCDSALAVVPTSTAAQYGKATALLELERYEESLAAYNALLENENTNSDALLGAGLAASHLSQTEEALEFYNRYLQLNPGNVQVRMTVAGRIADAGDYVSAYEVLEPAANSEENRGNPELQRYLFTLATAAGSRVATTDSIAARPYYEAALQAYQQAFPTDSVQPDISQVRQVIAVNTALGNTDEAIRIAQQATMQYDTVAAVWSQYASALEAAGQTNEAATALTRVIQLDPDFEDAYIRRGMVYLAGGQRDQAIADLQQAAQRGNQENVARVLFAEANKALTAQQYPEAEQLLETAASYATGETKGSIVFFQAVALFRQGEAIAKANTQGQVGPAREALALFEEALPLAQAGTHPSKADFVTTIQSYIANQQGVIRAGSR